MINASGGFTRTVKRGDRPQPLSKEDESALDKAWRRVAVARQTSEEKETTKTPQAANHIKI